MNSPTDRHSDGYLARWVEPGSRAPEPPLPLGSCGATVPFAVLPSVVSSPFLSFSLYMSRQRKRGEPPPPGRRPGRTSDGHCPLHPPHALSNSSVDLGSPNLASHPRGLLQNRGLNNDSPERRRRPGHGSLTNISRHDSLKKIDSPPIRRSTSSGQYSGFNDHKPLDPEMIAQVGCL